jgi:flagellar basal-body rod protein FlgB
MLNEMFASSSIPALEQMVNFAQARHAVLATNVANIDVPGYRTRDLSEAEFQAKLKDAMATRDTDRSGSLMSGERITVDPFAKVGREMNDILHHDDGNVGLEQQVAAITKNHMQHSMALSVLNSQFRLLQTAVSERA